jgi:hypothetical protein
VLSVPDEICNATGMARFDLSLDLKQPHGFLASMHQTRKAVLPVHSAPELKLFSQLVKREMAFQPSPKDPDWKSAVRVWNRFAENTPNVFYKVSNGVIFIVMLVTNI